MPRIAEIAANVDVVLEDGSRDEVLRLLSLLTGRAAVATLRAQQLLAKDAPVRSSFLQDQWITPADAASRLGHCERWLRRRRFQQPYCAFCISQKRGFKVSLQGLQAHMEQERKRAANE